MYFTENKLKNFQIISASTEELLDDNEQIYTFHCFFPVLKEVVHSYLHVIHVTTYKDNNKGMVQFVTTIISDNEIHKNKILKNIISIFDNMDTKSFFFNNPYDAIIEHKADNYSYGVTFNIKLSGTLKLDIKNEFYYLQLVEKNEKIKELSNEKTLTYLLKNAKDIINDATNTIPVLINSFDINSNDFLEAVKLHYEY